ncbi:class I SAM-dependent methyltransferase [Streptomyces lavendulae]|uniref:class I SAM-dependent methyltransferase n=1 Tax=Streptomyces lavendulae TaxID=1914 RepID=UPI0025576654|nr:class I SAM-dependent methyltransferase [Streptomyces lavendulae]
MTILTPRVIEALGRFNDAHPWDHNAHYHRWILRRLPRCCARALDVGSGSGDLARALTGRAAAVHGVDADPRIVARARELTPAGAPVTFAVGEALAQRGTYEVVTCVAVLHHLPFDEALGHFRERLAPGGTLVVVGAYRASTPGDHLLGAVAVPLNAALGWIKNKGRTAPRPPSMTAPTRPASMTFAEIADGAARLLPGARLRRRLFWRYTLVWRRH